MSDEKPSGVEKPAPQASPPSPASQPQSPPASVGAGTFSRDSRDKITVVIPVEKKNR